MSKNQENSTKTISIMMLITMVGKVLGLYRDRLLAVHYGVGMEANAFYTASRIPRVFFDAVFASAIAACFIPVFSEYLTKKGKESAFRFSGHFITVMAVLCTVLSGVGIVFAESLVHLFADGYDAPTAALAVSLTRVMFPTVLFTGVAFSFVGVLQSMGEFNIPALISSISNCIIILYYFTLNDTFGIYGLAVAFVLGWLMQAVVQVPALKKKGFRYYPGLDVRSEGMKKVFALMLPVMVSTWVQPINLTINSRFASHLYEGAGVSAIEIATNLYLIIAGVFVLSITNVIFPKLSRLTAGNDEGAFRETLNTTMHGCLFFVLPMAAGVMVVSRPLVQFIYGDGQFDAFAVEITAQALFWVALGMVGYAMQNILSRAYFARQEGRGPLVAGLISILVNLVLCMVLTDRLQVAGLAIATSVSSTVYALLLDLPLERRGEGFLNGSFLLELGKMAAATVAMALCAWCAMGVTAGLFSGKLGLLVSMGAAAAVGVAVYFVAALILRLKEAAMVCDIAKGILKRG